jgi:transglutaminase-like putative cysteine protease
MKFKVKADLDYDVKSPATIILNIHALRSANQMVLEEVLTINPYMKAEELTSSHGENRFLRLEVPDSGLVTIQYTATVDNSFKLIDFSNVAPVSVAALDTSVFPYLYPSRYCQSDKLYRFANKKFGNIENPFATVLAVMDWIHSNIEYLSGSSDSSTSAYDTITEQAGVCRDFAHLGISLCRALTIPARYFTGFAYQLNPPDFHACFEAYLGGEWVLFDATKLAPLNGIVKIATGRDAADSAVASLYGDVNGNGVTVSCELDEEKFEPYFYKDGALEGISYL